MSISYKSFGKVLTIIFILIFIFLIFQEKDKTNSVIAIDYLKVISNSCAKILNAEHLQVDSQCKEVNFKIDKTKFKNEKIYFLVEVNSDHVRTGVYLRTNEGWNYGYHSGDGKKQILYLESSVPKDDLVVRLINDENNQSMSTVDFYRMYISSDLQSLMSTYPFLKNEWVRTNNPNQDFHFDRYTSLVENFSITVPNINNPIWEKKFGLGINDRNNTGDFYCFPDDKLMFISGRNINWIYLGFLDWKLKIYSKGNSLIFEYSFNGPLQLDPSSAQAHARKVKEDNFGSKKLLEMPDRTAKLTKKYTFNTHHSYAYVELSGELSYDEKIYWIVEDASYMDFQLGNNMDVRSYFKGKENISLFRFSEHKLSPDKFIQFRTYQNYEKNLASYYYSNNANIHYIINRYLPVFLNSHPDIVSSLLKNETLDLNLNETGPYIYGIGFIGTEGHLKANFEMHFKYGFGDARKL